MKILHTADWHIGKKLYRYDLHEDFQLFSNWLAQFLEQHNVEVLLISGDIFDTANPSSESRKLFYQALLSFQQRNCTVILTGGNHDSPAVLNAPKDLLSTMQIKVVGNLPESPSDFIFPLYEKEKDTPEVVVCAIPYLREADLRKANDADSYEDRLAIIQEGIETIFKKASAYCAKHYPTIPKIGMGHLFTAGVSLSDSEREIQLGNEAKFDAQRFSNFFNYLALGHIHKPQKINALFPAYYAGAPIPLSFSERKDEKRVLLIDTKKGFEPESITIPSFRKLIRISGTLEKIELKLSLLNEKSTLRNLLEIVLIEEHYSAAIEDSFNRLCSEFSHPDYEIVKTKIQWRDASSSLSQLYPENNDLENLSPSDVFSKIIENQEINDSDKKKLEHAFSILVEEVLTQE